MSRRNKQMQAADAFSNSLFRLGAGSQSPLEATTYPMTRMTQNYALLNSLYRNSWITQNIITTIPDDMLREWVTLNGITQQAKDQMNRLMRRTALRDKLAKGFYWGRLYGGAVGIMMIRGHDDLSQPLDLNAVLPGAFLGLYVVDRWSGVFPQTELVTDMSDQDFGLPAYYSVQGADGAVAQRVHHSRVIRFVGRELPYVEKIAEMYWGESEIEAVYDEIVKRDNVSHNMAALTFRACRDYMEVDNLDQLLSTASPAQQKRLYGLLQAQSVIDSNFGTKVVNKGDAVHNTQYTFAGLADVYNSVMMDVSGASRIPVTKLFGRSAAGMNATGEGDLQNYYDYIDTRRESDLRPIMERLLPVMALSCWGEVPDGLDLAFPPLWTPKASEVADIADKKAGVVVVGYQSGLLDKGTAQGELKKLSGETGMFDSIPDEQIQQNMGVSYQNQQAMHDPLAGLTIDTVPTADGGAGSGNFNHAGRPGQVGGSGDGGDLTNSSHGGILQPSQKVSPTGENKFLRGFSEKNLDRHWGGTSDHSAQYPGMTREQYAQAALSLVQSPADGKSILGYSTASGAVVRYDVTTNDFVKGYPGNGIATMYKPTKGVKYFNAQKAKEG